MLLHRPPSSWLTLAFVFLIVACQAAPTAPPVLPAPVIITATPAQASPTDTVPVLGAAATVPPIATGAAAVSTATEEPTVVPPTPTQAIAVSTSTEEPTAVPPTVTEPIAFTTPGAESTVPTPSEVITQAVMADDTTCDTKDPAASLIRSRQVEAPFTQS